MLFEQLQVYDDRELRSAAMNMAVDEALLLTTTAPLLRFYGWRTPSLSFGYFGRFADVADQLRERELVRRWTGGGIVLHDDDVTYSVILPASHSSASKPSRALYAGIHEAIREAISDSADVKLAAHDAPKVSEGCFANPVRADVIADGRKIAGAAQRRTRAGLLHQGSVQYDRLPADFTRRFAVTLSAHYEPAAITQREAELALQIAAEKYATDAWLRRR